MQRPALGRRTLILALAFAVSAGSCSGDNASTDGLAPRQTAMHTSCPELGLGAGASGFEVVENFVDTSVSPSGKRATLRASDGRSVTLIAGIEGEWLEGSRTVAMTTVLGREARVVELADQRGYLWRQAPIDQPCGQYGVITAGFSAQDADRLIEGITLSTPR